MTPQRVIFFSFTYHPSQEPGRDFNWGSLDSPRHHDVDRVDPWQKRGRRIPLTVRQCAFSVRTHQQKKLKSKRPKHRAHRPTGVIGSKAFTARGLTLNADGLGPVISLDMQSGEYIHEVGIHVCGASGKAVASQRRWGLREVGGCRPEGSRRMRV